jgi:hypothetical protein
MVRAWVGWVVYVPFSIIWDFCVRPNMVLNQRQRSIVVPDWEPYLGSLVSLLSCGCLFSVSVFVPHGTVLFVSFSHVYCFVFQCSFWLNIMDTYHAVHWSSDPSRYSSSEEEDVIPYTHTVRLLYLNAHIGERCRPAISHRCIRRVVVLATQQPDVSPCSWLLLPWQHHRACWRCYGDAISLLCALPHSTPFCLANHHPLTLTHRHGQEEVYTVNGLTKVTLCAHPLQNGHIWWCGLVLLRKMCCSTVTLFYDHIVLAYVTSEQSPSQGRLLGYYSIVPVTGSVFKGTCSMNLGEMGRGCVCVIIPVI